MSKKSLLYSFKTQQGYSPTMTKEELEKAVEEGQIGGDIYAVIVEVDDKRVLNMQYIFLAPCRVTVDWQSVRDGLVELGSREDSPVSVVLEAPQPPKRKRSGKRKKKNEPGTEVVSEIKCEED